MSNPEITSEPSCIYDMSNSTKTIYAVVKVTVKADAEYLDDILGECEYSFAHEDIVETEIVGQAEEFPL